jgi:hypothetical protein
MLSEFLKRLPSTAKEERALVEAAFGLRGTVAEKAAAIRGDQRLSEAGKAADIRAMALGNPREHLRQIRSRAAAMRADAQNARLAMQPKAPDRNDLAGEARRREMRDYLRSLPAEQRLRVAMESAEMTEAVIDAPHPALSGLSAEHLDLVRDGHMEKTFGPQLREIEQREKVIEVVNSAIEVATSQFRKETGLSEESLELKDN